METKLNHSNLSALLAKEANISHAKAELLTKNFFDLIIEGLEHDGSVKINNLGTFKITDVASRSSVNVNTGEKFEIKGHGKISFVPADALKEAVNQPFAMFEPVEVDETYTDEPLSEKDSEEVETEAVESDTVVTPAAEHICDNESVTIETEAVEEVKISEVAEIVESIPEEIVEETPCEVVDTAGIEEEIPCEEPQDTAPIYINNEIEEEQPVVEEEVTVKTEAKPKVETLSAVVEEEIVQEAATEQENEVETQESVAQAVAENNEAVEHAEKNTESVPVIEQEQQKPVAAVVEERRTPVMVTVPKKTHPNRLPKNNAATKKHKSYKGLFATLFIIAICGIAYVLCDRTDTTVSVAVEEPAAIPVQQTVNETVTEQRYETDATSEATIATSTPDVELVGEVESNITSLVETQAAVESEEEYMFVKTSGLETLQLSGLSVADTIHYVSVGELARHKVAADETLTRISLKYYGDKRLWPYIVKYNNLAKPNDLCKGMEVLIPKLLPAN